MKKSYQKVVWRGIFQSLGRFLAIFGIVALGVGFLAGLLATTPDMRQSADAFLDQHALYDIRVIGTLGLTKDDIAAVAAIEEVQAVMPSYTADVLTDSAALGENVPVRLHSLPDDPASQGEDDLNRLTLLDGRWPQAPDECVIVHQKLTEQPVAIGDSLTLSKDNVDLSDTLAVSSLTVVGRVESGAYFSVESEPTTIGRGSLSLFVFVPAGAFAYEAYTDLYIRVAGAMEQIAFEDGYWDVVDPVLERLEGCGVERSQLRLAQLVADAQLTAQQELNEKRQDVQRELDEAKRQLEEARDEIAKGRQELQEASTAYETGWDAYQNGCKTFEAEIQAQKAALDQKAEELQMFQKQLQELENALREVQKTIAALRQEIADLRENGQDDLADAAQLRLEAMEADYAENKQEFEEKTRALTNAEKEWEAGYALYENARKEGEKQLDKTKNELEAAQKELTAGEEKLATAQKELRDGEAAYAASAKEAEQALQDAEREIEEQIEELKGRSASWMVLDRRSNASFASFDGNAQKVEAIARVFPVFFFLVAALVALTTMTRMVEEERGQIGTLKALGYTKGAIIGKYLLYAALATVLGCVAGLLVGFKLFPAVIWKAYDIMYHIPVFVAPFRVPYAAVASFAALLCTLFATVAACYHTLRERSSRLLLPKAPKAGKRIFLERISPLWKHLSFTQKVTARNLIRYKKRFFMTVIGIAGCTALLLTGFGLRDSISDIIERQFGELYRYNLIIGLKDGQSEETQAYLTAQGATQLMRAGQSSVTASSPEGEKTSTLYVPESVEKLAQNIVLRERLGGRKLELTDDGVLLTEKLAETLDVRAGDRVVLKKDNGTSVETTVSGVTENYVYSYVYMSPTLYKQLYQQEPEINLMVARVADGEEQREDMGTALMKLDEVSGVQFARDIRDNFANVVDKINYIVVVLILSAGLLAFVVLYNLININITERHKEIATLRVLGFYDREAGMYIYREIGILSLIGAGVGLVLGIFLHAFVVRTAEVDMVMFGRTIAPLSYLLSAVITLIFTVLVCLVMYPKIRRIDLVESMKAGE